VLDFTLGIAAAIVSAVGDDQQSLAGIASLLHFVEGQVHSVEKGSPPLGLRKREPVLNFFQVGGEVLHQVGGIVELDQEKLVFRIRRLEELGDRLARLFQLVAHAAAAIENDADRERRILAGKRDDFLLFFVFE